MRDTTKKCPIYNTYMRAVPYGTDRKCPKSPSKCGYCVDYWTSIVAERYTGLGDAGSPFIG